MIYEENKSNNENDNDRPKNIEKRGSNENE